MQNLIEARIKGFKLQGFQVEGWNAASLKATNNGGKPLGGAERRPPASDRPIVWTRLRNGYTPRRIACAGFAADVYESRNDEQSGSLLAGRSTADGVRETPLRRAPVDAEQEIRDLVTELGRVLSASLRELT
jgi:hypothetical protein